MIITVASFKGGESIAERGTSGIYAIRNTANGKCYVGSAVSLPDRLYNHRWHLERGTHRNRKLLNAWRKHSAGAFTFEILEVVGDTGALLAREQYWIDALNSHTGGYNLNPTAGSNYGRKFGTEYRQKVAEAARRAMAAPDVKERHKAAMRAAMASPEVREKCRAAIARRHANPEQRAHLVAAVASPEAIEKRRQSLIRYYQANPRSRKNPPKSPRAPVRYEVTSPDGTSETIVNLKAFCRERGIPYPSAQNVLNGRVKAARGHLIRKVGG